MKTPFTFTGTKSWETYLPLVFIVSILSMIGWQLYRLSSMSQYLENSDHILYSLNQMDQEIARLGKDVRSFLLTRDQGYKKDFDQQIKSFQNKADEVENLSEDDKVLKRSLEELREDFKSWKYAAQNVMRLDAKELELRRYDFTFRKLLNKSDSLLGARFKHRNVKKEMLQTSTISLFFWTSIGLLVLTALYFIAWVRSRQGSQALKESELKARLAESRFRSLLESAHDLIMITDDQGKIIFVNDKLLNTFGYQKEELMGKEMEILVPPHLRSKHAKLRTTYLQHPIPRTMNNNLDLTGLRKDGKEIPLEISLSPFISEGKYQVASIIRDVTQRKELEKRQLWLSDVSKLLNQTLNPEELIQELCEYTIGRVADWLVVIPYGQEMKVIYPEESQKSLRMDLIPWTSSDAELDMYLKRIVDSHHSFLKKNITKEDTDNFPLSPIQRKYIYKLGMKSIIVTPMQGRDRELGTIVHVKSHDNYSKEDVGYIQNLVSRASLALDNARLYQFAQESVLARDELLRIVSHDLKNPLSAIKLNGQLLERHVHKDLNDEEFSLKRVSAIEKSADQAISLIKDLLDEAKIETGGFTLSKEPCNPWKILSDVEAVYASLAEEKGIRFKSVTEVYDRIDLLVDNDRILQVLSNLVSNAIKYTPPGGEILVHVKKHIEGLIFQVQDSGAGIEKDKQPYIFSKYWKKEKEKGGLHLGLGLAIVKGIVEAHHGKIWVNSEPGKGSTFHFLIPYEGNSIKENDKDDKNNIISI